MKSGALTGFDQFQNFRRKSSSFVPEIDENLLKYF
jgi:hypothetical protein